jgi:predicted lipoprotein
MKYILALITTLAATPVFADVTQTVDQHILPGYAAFDKAADDLARTARDDCSVRAVRPAWHATFDAWMQVSHLKFGPVEDAGRSVSIAFWPDTRGAGPRALAALIADADPVIETPQGTAQISIAARGLFALEYLLFEDQFADAGSYGCALMRALTADLAAMAQETHTAWVSDHAALLRRAGAIGNPVYLSAREGTQILFTSLITGLEFTADQRLGRPMGSFERPRPKRAENWRAGRSLRNVVLSLEALRDLTVNLAQGEAPLTLAAFDKALKLAGTLDDPTLASVSVPQGRFKIEVLQQAVNAIQTAALSEIGAALGVSPGFNSADGD